jgi:hypothetical protein
MKTIKQIQEECARENGIPVEYLFAQPKRMTERMTALRKLKWKIKLLCWHRWIWQWKNAYSKGSTYECNKCGRWKNYGM